MSDLPTNPAELIRLAIFDLELCENSPKYKIDMNVFHRPLPYQNICRVCLAGSVMAQSLNADPSISYCTRQFHDCRALRALDYFRRGYIRCGMQLLCFRWTDTDRTITPYKNSPEEFKKDMLEMADYIDANKDKMIKEE